MHYLKKTCWLTGWVPKTVWKLRLWSWLDLKQDRANKIGQNWHNKKNKLEQGRIISFGYVRFGYARSLWFDLIRGCFFLLMSVLSKFVLALSCLRSSHDHNLCFKNSFWSSPFKPTWFVFVKMPQIIFYQIGSFYSQKSYFWSNHGR